MITKERLEELIEQGATIYSTNWQEKVDLSLPCEIIDVFHGDGVVREHLRVHEGEGFTPSYLLSGLTEDIETAKWEEEFGCIERTERLVLPTWEELQNKREFYIGFNNNEGIVRYYLAIDMPYQKDYGAILISYSDANNDTVICFDKIATKENYTIACRKAKELFLGERK